MKTLRFLLLPFGLIFYSIILIRSWLYQIKFLKSYSPNIPCIVVGNISTGGTGKTPFTEYLISILKKEYNIAVLSRGYGRKTRGLVIAENKLTAIDIGDEPFQIYKKFNLPTIVSEDRKEGVLKIVSLFPKVNLIILDDALQHKKIKPKISILLTTFKKPFFKDFILPLGNLREPRHMHKKADITVVTKCPKNITNNEIIKFKNNITQASTNQFFFFFNHLLSPNIFQKNSYNHS